MTDINIEYIKVFYIDVYESAKNFIMLKKRIDNYINENYQVNTLENIIKHNEFNNEISNANNGIKTDNILNKFAQKYKKYFDIYKRQTYILKEKIGMDKTKKIMKILETYQF